MLGFKACLARHWFMAAVFIVGFPMGAGAMQYLHVAGQITGVAQDKIFADMKSQLIDPIDQARAHIEKSYSGVVDAAGGFYFNLIVDPVDQAGEDFLRQYFSSSASTGFHGNSIQVSSVKEIVEQVNLASGKHRANSSDDAFDVTSQTFKEFRLGSVRQWIDFTDHLGFSLASTDHGRFINYLGWFFQNSQDLDNYLTKTLDHSDVVLAELTPIIHLENGTSVTSDDASPFFDMPFARNCWMSKFENGNCWKKLLEKVAKTF